MDTTSPSLLERLQQPLADGAWERFVDLYTPLLFRWSRKMGLNETDAGELVQEVFVALIDKLTSFNYDPTKSFRGWLRTIALNLWRQKQRRRKLAIASGSEAELADVAVDGEIDEYWEQQYRLELVQRAMHLIAHEFQPTTWRAFCEYVVKDREPEVVARELNTSTSAVYIAKSRVLRRLRTETLGLLD